METYAKTLDKALNYFSTVSKGKEIDVRVTLTLELFFKNKGKHYSVRDVYDYLSGFNCDDDLTKPKVKYILEEMAWHGILTQRTKEEESILVKYHSSEPQKVVDEKIENEDGSITLNSPYDGTVILYDAKFDKFINHRVEQPFYYVAGKRKINVTRAYYYLED